jgi:hypothetical protein
VGELGRSAEHVGLAGGGEEESVEGDGEKEHRVEGCERMPEQADIVEVFARPGRGSTASFADVLARSTSSQRPPEQEANPLDLDIPDRPGSHLLSPEQPSLIISHPLDSRIVAVVHRRVFKSPFTQRSELALRTQSL